MPRGKWDRNKTKAQRAAEKANKKGPRASGTVPVGFMKPLVGESGAGGDLKGCCGGMAGNSGSFISMKDKADVLMDYLTTLVNARRVLDLGERETSFDKAIANTLVRLEGFANVLQPLPVGKDEIVAEKPENTVPVTPVAPAPAPVSAPVPAPIAAAPAPIAFNAPVPAPIAVPKI